MIESIDHNQPAYFYMNQYEVLACPARFERATYALEGRKLTFCKRLLLAESGPSAPKQKPPRRIALVTILVTRVLYLYKPLSRLLTWRRRDLPS